MEEQANLFRQSENKEEVVGKDLPSYGASKEVFLTFKENRSYELHVGRDILRFEGRETKKVTEAMLRHKDFTESVAEKFVIREVK